MKKVIYNGGYLSYHNNCKLPNLLQIGHVYTVVGEKESEYHTEYTLKEVPGEYNSVWFDSILPTYLATSDSVPEVDKRFVCNRYEGGRFVRVHATAAQNVQMVGVNTYKVRTKNSIYVVQVVW